MKTVEVMERLRQRFPGPAWAFLEAVRNGTGASRNARTVDALAMSLWPSRGLHLHGFEVKVSRGDWLREVRDPEKAEEIARYCHFWWLVAPPGVVDETLIGPELPATWGFLRVDEKEITVVREAAQLQPQAPDHLFLAAVLRRVCSYATDQAKLEEARKQGRADGFEAGKSSAEEMGKFARKQHEQLTASVDAFQEASGVRISAYDGAQIGNAVRLVLRGGIEDRFRRLGESARGISDEVDKALADLGSTPGATE